MLIRVRPAKISQAYDAAVVSRRCAGSRVEGSCPIKRSVLGLWRTVFEFPQPKADVHREYVPRAKRDRRLIGTLFDLSGLVFRPLPQ